MTKQFAVLGQPVAHSLSPAIHQAAYRALKLDWQYGKFEVGVDQLPEFLAAHSEYAGFSVTMPLKQAAANLASSQCVITAATGIANTLVQQPNGGYAAHNTDVPALAKIFKERYEPQKVVILGAGATAISAAVAATLVGAQEIYFVARRQEAAQQAAATLATTLQRLAHRTAANPQLHALSFAAIAPDGAHPGDAAHQGDARAQLGDTDLTVNALPGDAVVSLPQQLLESDLFDVSYSPWPTATATKWLAQSTKHTVTNGLVMLQQQAIFQLRLFLNQDIRAQLPNEAAVWQEINAAVTVK